MHLIGCIVLVALFLYPTLSYTQDLDGGIAVMRKVPSGKAKFSKRVVVDPITDESYGWWIEVGTSKKTVKVTQILTCPVPPKSWGSLEKVGKISSDNKTLTIVEKQNVSPKGMISYAFNVADGYPQGIYEIKVVIDDSQVKHFNFILK